jgi:subtilisin-like proprotein convertase family protein
MRKIKVLLFLVMFLFGITSVYAQLNDATVSGPSVKGVNAQQEVHSVPIPMDQRVPRTNTPIQGDEYGSYNYNAMFSSGTTGGYVAAPMPYNENFDGAIECWVYPNATTNSAPFIIAKGDATAISFGLLWINTGSIGFRIGNSYTACTVTGNVPLNQWTHVAASWTGGPAFVITFFVNGVAAGTTVNNSGVWTANNDSLTIGSSRAGFAQKDFLGYIDEVRIWSGPRTALEIATNRFVGLGDGANANAGSALTSSSSYSTLTSSYTFNSGGAAYDDINGYTGFYRNGAGPVYTSLLANPLPYNFALKLAAGTNDYVTVPSNAIFNQTVDGSIDAWIKLSAVGLLQTICSKGTSFATHNYAFYVTSGNKIGLNIGAHNYMSTGPTIFAVDKWYHVAATWTGGPNFTVKLYVNGVLDDTQTFNLAMPTNTDPFIIGRYYSAGTGLFNGYLDEVRVWNIALTPAQITKYMFNSVRSGTLPTSCVGAWNFDGNLNNFTATTGVNGSFNTAVPNNGRLSGYTNEATITGPPVNSLVAHTTVVNRFATPNPFPDGFNIRLTNKAIADNTTTKDTIKFAASRTITSVELFLAIQHTFVGDLTINLIAPNGTSRSVVAAAGGTGENILTFVIDGGPVCSTTGFFAPWSYYCGPAAVFGNFGGANMQGNWVLIVADGAAGDQGMIQGWGLRFNGDNITGVSNVSNEIPGKYNLSQNYPNPFNPVTKISFALPKSGLVTLKVYDVLGKEVETLVNEVKTAGTYSVDFNASKYSSGAYFYKIETNGFADVKKMMLVK